MRKRNIYQNSSPLHDYYRQQKAARIFPFECFGVFKLILSEKQVSIYLHALLLILHIESTEIINPTVVSLQNQPLESKIDG